jgi:dienelactone hydrolase
MGTWTEMIFLRIQYFHTMIRCSLLAVFLQFALFLNAQKTLQFPSADGLTITADWYDAGPDAPILVLCHQAGWSRGEYKETAPLLLAGGYSCLAIDQRSGEAINGVKNETATLAKAKKLPCEYLDAEKDIVAAVEYAYATWGRQVILVGSSYSAGLALKIAKENPHVMAVAAFSPGEYYGDKLNLTKAINGLNKPVFLTSSQEEAIEVSPFLKVISSANKVQYNPAVAGKHGSHATWKEFEGYLTYRRAFWKWIRGL